MKKSLGIVIALCLSVVGCGGYDATSEDAVAEVSGCKIIRIRIKGEGYPLYLAKCKETATFTYNTGGKNNHTGVTVTAIEKEMGDLERTKTELDKKKAALDKLSDEEKAILGLQ